uniref:Uncharacterized protein n=1 Tax=Anguilla anguilla TaxID=7936 RepID=A0A0E9XJW6_ANGAN
MYSSVYFQNKSLCTPPSPPTPLFSALSRLPTDTMSGFKSRTPCPTERLPLSEGVLQYVCRYVYTHLELYEGNF